MNYLERRVPCLAAREILKSFNLLIASQWKSSISQREEVYSLTDQIRRSSRSVATNLAEGFRKRRYANMLINKLTDCDGEATETQVWLDFALDCGYLSKDNHVRLTLGYEEVGRMLSGMMANPSKFAPSGNN
jgi:four helix bundle protein